MGKSIDQSNENNDISRRLNLILYTNKQLIEEDIFPR